MDEGCAQQDHRARHIMDIGLRRGAVSSPQTLYFTTGLDLEQDGLFGTLTAQ